MGDQKDGRVYSLNPFVGLTLYYGLIAATIVILLRAFPAMIDYMPVGGAGTFATSFGSDIFEPVALGAPDVSGILEGTIKLLLAMSGAFIVMLPVTWVYLGTRKRSDISQAFVSTILLLPIAVTGVVHVVRNSLALAFSLAGIVAGVRFRHTLKDTGDAIYLFTAIGVGLASGIGAFEIAATLSIFFNYVVLTLWIVGFAAEATGTQSFARHWMTKKKKKKKKDKKDKKEKPADEIRQLE